MYTKFLLLVLLSLGVVSLVACGDDDDDDTPTAAASTATATPRPPESTATPVATPTQTARTTGIADLDSLIALTTKGDLAGLTARVQLSVIACTTTPSGVGSPPRCEGTETNGAQVATFPYASCEGEYLRPAQVPKLFEDYFKNASLYAVIKLKPPIITLPAFQQGVYGLIFEADAAPGPPREAAMLMVNDAGKIVIVWRGCAETAAGLYDDRLKASVVLPPK